MYSWSALNYPFLGADNTVILLGALVFFSAFALAIVLLLIRAYRSKDDIAVDNASERLPAANETDARHESAGLTDPSSSPAPPSNTTDSPPIFAHVFSLNELLPPRDDRHTGGEWQNGDIEEEYIPNFEYPELQDSAVGEGDRSLVEQSAGKVLANLKARTYLEQVNEHVLMERGSIVAEPGKLKLFWQTTTGIRSIAVTAGSEQELMINGIPFETSETGVKKGIVASLNRPA